MNGLQAAVGFLTRVPARARTFEGDDADRTMARAVPWFPAVGAAIGTVVGLAYWLASRAVTPIAAAVIAVTIGAAVTGAFHEDGLADTADALWGGYDRQRRLDIMKDSRHGTFGVLALVLVSALRITALASLTPGLTAVGALVAAHALGRGGAVALMASTPAARADGLGARYMSELRAPHAVAGVAVAVLAALAGLAGWFVVAVAAAASVAVAMRSLAMAKLGGIVGDVLGAVEQVIEAVVLLLASALVRHGATQLGWWPR